MAQPHNGDEFPTKPVTHTEALEKFQECVAGIVTLLRRDRTNGQGARHGQPQALFTNRPDAVRKLYFFHEWAARLSSTSEDSQNSGASQRVAMPPSGMPHLGSNEDLPSHPPSITISMQGSRRFFQSLRALLSYRKRRRRAAQEESMRRQQDQQREKQRQLEHHRLQQRQQDADHAFSKQVWARSERFWRTVVGTNLDNTLARTFAILISCTTEGDKPWLSPTRTAWKRFVERCMAGASDSNAYYDRDLPFSREKCEQYFGTQEAAVFIHVQRDYTVMVITEGDLHKWNPESTLLPISTGNNAAASQSSVQVEVWQDHWKGPRANAGNNIVCQMLNISASAFSYHEVWHKASRALGRSSHLQRVLATLRSPDTVTIFYDEPQNTLKGLMERPPPSSFSDRMALFKQMLDFVGFIVDCHEVFGADDISSVFDLNITFDTVYVEDKTSDLQGTLFKLSDRAFGKLRDKNGIHGLFPRTPARDVCTSPELLSLGSEIEKACDVFALGALVLMFSLWLFVKSEDRPAHEAFLSDVDCKETLLVSGTQGFQLHGLVEPCLEEWRSRVEQPYRSLFANLTANIVEDTLSALPSARKPVRKLYESMFWAYNDAFGDLSSSTLRARTPPAPKNASEVQVRDEMPKVRRKRMRDIEHRLKDHMKRTETLLKGDLHYGNEFVPHAECLAFFRENKQDMREMLQKSRDPGQTMTVEQENKFIDAIVPTENEGHGAMAKVLATIVCVTAASDPPCFEAFTKFRDSVLAGQIEMADTQFPKEVEDCIVLFGKQQGPHFYAKQRPFWPLVLREDAEVIQGRHPIPILKEELIGQGSAGKVFKCILAEKSMLSVDGHDFGHRPMARKFVERVGDNQSSWNEWTATRLLKKSSKDHRSILKTHFCVRHADGVSFFMDLAGDKLSEFFRIDPIANNDQGYRLEHLFSSALDLTGAVDQCHGGIEVNGQQIPLPHLDLNLDNVVTKVTEVATEHGTARKEIRFLLIDFHTALALDGRSNPGRMPRTNFANSCKAPEWETSMEISDWLATDVWSVGCILCSWVIWLSKGPDGVRAFDNLRRQEGNNDGFYTIGPDGTANVKSAVVTCLHAAVDNMFTVQAEYRRFQSICSLIVDHMLRPRPKDRWKMAKIHKCLREITSARGATASFSELAMLHNRVTVTASDAALLRSLTPSAATDSGVGGSSTRISKHSGGDSESEEQPEVPVSTIDAIGLRPFTTVPMGLPEAASTIAPSNTIAPIEVNEPRDTAIQTSRPQSRPDGGDHEAQRDQLHLQASTNPSQSTSQTSASHTVPSTDDPEVQPLERTKSRVRSPDLRRNSRADEDKRKSQQLSQEQKVESHRRRPSTPLQSLGSESGSTSAPATPPKSSASSGFRRRLHDVRSSFRRSTDSGADTAAQA